MRKLLSLSLLLPALALAGGFWGGSASTANVSAPTSATCTVSPSTIAPGSSTTLSCTGAGGVGAGCYFDQGVGAVPGCTTTVSPPGNSGAQIPYTGVRLNSAGSSTAAATTVTLLSAPVINSYSWTPSSSTAGSTRTLTCSVTGATSLTLDNGIGAASCGNTTVAPTSTTTYTLTATNAAGSVQQTATATVSGLTQAGTPTFSPAAGTYTSAQSVTVSRSTGSVTCYTTNGTTPATNGTSACTTGTAYSSPIAVSTTTTVQAVAGGTGYSDSNVGSAAYTINIPSLPVTDSFAGTGALSSNWTTLYAVNGTPQRQSDSLYVGTWGVALISYTGVSFPNNQWAEVQIPAESSGQIFDLYVRYSGAYGSGTGYLLRFQDGGAPAIRSVAAGVETWLTLCGSYTAGHTYRLIANGTRISVTDNGTETCSVTDSTATAGTPAIEMECNATCPTVRNFQAD